MAGTSTGTMIAVPSCSTPEAVRLAAAICSIFSSA
jgi:hypothetical protein